MLVDRRALLLACAILPAPLVFAPSVSAVDRASAKGTPEIIGLHAFASDDVWAVGATFVRQRAVTTLARHWDGQSWSTIAPPSPGAGQNALYAVSGTGSNDVWAVGYDWAGPQHGGRGRPEKLLALHWDGVSWTSVHVQQPDLDRHIDARLYDVVALAPDDAWAVGQLSQGDSAILEHWDGTTWSLVSDDPDDALTLRAVSGSGEGDVWVIGNQPAVTWHFDGSGWQSIKGVTGTVRDVVAPAPDAAWVTGSGPLLWHWNGRSWRTQNVPGQPGTWGSLAATSATDVWATGLRGDYPHVTSALYHSDGTTWSTVDLPRALVTAQLFAISADAVDDVWVYGIRHGDSAQGIFGHWDGTSWHVQT